MFGVSYEERGRDPHIYVQSTTLNCAIVKACVPCLYKLFPDGKEDKLLMDVLSTTHSLCFPCNQRPELCPRSKLTEQQMNQLGIYDQAGEDEQRLQILTVGDGDFSFSLSLASHVLKEAGNTTSLTATSHESLKSVLDTYHPHSKDTLAKLKSFGATVLHGVDATNLAATSELRSKSSTTLVEEESEPAGEKVKMKRFDFVIWNFPCLSLPAGADGQATELQANQELLSKFFSNVHALLNKHTGEVHISHKTVEPFSWWGIKKLAKDNGFDFAYAIVFDRCNYPGYTNRKALDRKSFPCNDAQIYVFVPSKRVRKTIKHSDKHHKGTLTDDNQAAASLSTERVGLALGDAARCSQLPHLLERNVLVPTFGEEFVTRMRAHLLKLYSSNDNSYDKSFEPAQKKQKKF